MSTTVSFYGGIDEVLPAKIHVLETLTLFGVRVYTQNYQTIGFII